MTMTARRPSDGRSTVGALPPPDVLDLAELPELARAVEHLATLRAERRTIREKLEGLANAVRQAEHQDIEAAAAAHRRGEPDPGSPAAEQVETETAETNRRMTIVTAAIDSATVDLGELIMANRDAWLAKLGGKVTKRREKVRRLAEQWAEGRFELASLQAMSYFLREFPDRSAFRPIGRAIHGSKETIDSIMSLLIRDAEGPRAEQAESEAA
ncbi:MAG: hypothetical protein ACR2I5_05770 [Candidatus Limnocylindria bacterium]